MIAGEGGCGGWGCSMSLKKAGEKQGSTKDPNQLTGKYETGTDNVQLGYTNGHANGDVELGEMEEPVDE